MDGQGFTQYFGSLASTVGNAVNNANTARYRAIATGGASQESAAAGFGSVSGRRSHPVVQLQSSYQAASKVVTVIDDITQSLIAMIPT